MPTRADMERELRTLQEDLRANKRSVTWGSVIVLAFAAVVLPALSVRAGVAVAVGVTFLAINGWAIVTGRRRIEALKRQLDGRG